MKSLRLKRQFDSHILKMSRQTSNFYAVLGDHAGNVEANDRGDVYIRDWGGNVSIVYNRVVPLDYNTVVEVGKVGSSRRLEVIRLVETIPGNRGIDIPQHAKFHTWGGKDTVWIREEQILQGLAIPVPSSLVVRYYGTRYSIDGTRHILVPQDIDLSSEVPSSSGAYWCNVEVDSDGDIFFNLGTPVISKYFLAPEDIPEVDTDRALLFTVKLYYGQTQIVKDLSDSDIWDPRFEVSNRDSGTGGGVQSVTGLDTDNTDPQNPVVAIAVDGTTITGDGTPGNPLVATGGSTPAGDDGEIQFNDGGAFGGDANFHYDAATNSLEIGGHVLDLTLLEGMINSITEGDSNGRMLFTFSDDITDGSFITFVRAKGTKASPTAVTDGTVIGYVRGRAWQQSGESFGNATDTQVEIQLVADGDWDVDDNPTRLEIYTTPAGSGTKALRMTIGSDGQITYHNYGDGTFEDTPAYFLGVDADGKVIEVDPADVADGWTAYSAVVPTRIASSLDGTFTVTIASPAVVTKNGHGLYLGQRLQLTTTGALPTGLATGTDYYVIYVDANTFRLATSLANAKAGTAINTSGTQSGTHSIVCNLDPAYRIQFAGVDLSSTLQESMPIKWTQNSIVRYGWICSAPTYSGGNTTFHVLTRCDSTSADYDVLDTGTYAISEFHYGLPKQPGTGFPALPEYWTMEMTDTGNQLASGATAGVDYNPAGLSLWVSIGTWKITGNHITWVEFTGTNLRFSVVGKVSDGISDIIGTYYFLATSTSLIANGGYDLSKHVRLTSPRTYHNLVQCGTSSPTALRVRGDISTTRINAVCAYL